MASYYSDFTLGNDSGTGAIGDPWKYCPGMTGWTGSATLSAGDTVNFKKGEIWQNCYLGITTTGTSGNRITYDAYGSGDDPIITGSVQTSSWDEWDVGGNPDRYRVSLASAPTQTWFVETDDSISWGIHETAIANLNAEYEWYHTGGYLYIYSPTDPNTRYSKIEPDQRDRCIDATNKNYITVQNLEFKFPAQHILRQAGTNWIIDNCHIHHAGRKDDDSRGVLLLGNNNTVSNNTIHNIGGVGLMAQAKNNTDGDNYLIEGNTVYDCYHNGIDVFNYGGNSQSLDNPILRYNYIYTSDDYDHAAGMFSCFYTKGGSSGNSITNMEIYYNLIYHPCANGIKLETYVNGAEVYNNTVCGDPASPANNVHGIQIGAVSVGVQNIKVKNNIVTDCKTYCFNVNDPASFASPSDVDNNVWYQSGYTNWVRVAGEASSPYTSGEFADYKSETGFDTNGLWENPDFVDSASGNCHLAFNSPCRDVGYDVGLTQDYDGVSVPQETNPAIGAFEYIVSLQTISAVGAIASTEEFGGTLLARLNRLYDKGREAFLAGDIDWASDTIKAVLVDSADYTLDLATDEFLDDIPSDAQVAISDALAGKSKTLGVADADDITITTVSGDQFEYIILFKDTGDSATSPLIMCIDSAVGLPFTPEAGSVKLKWSDLTSKIFKL